MRRFTLRTLLAPTFCFLLLLSLGADCEGGPPGAEELCGDGEDNDNDGAIDEGDDADGDGT